MTTLRNATLAIVAVATLIGAVPVFAGSISGQMMVTTRVIARAVVTMERQPEIVVTVADIARGYVDVTEPIQVRVRTNSRNGYLLQAEKTTEAFSTIELRNETTSMSVSSHETWLQRPYVAGGDVMSLRARLYLAPGTTPGAQAVPVAFSATPI